VTRTIGAWGRLCVLLSLDTSCRTVETCTERVGGRTTGVLVALGPVAVHLSWFAITFPEDPS
jgi:hypothetical protein